MDARPQAHSRDVSQCAWRVCGPPATIGDGGICTLPMGRQFGGCCGGQKGRRRRRAGWIALHSSILSIHHLRLVPSEVPRRARRQAPCPPPLAPPRSHPRRVRQPSAPAPRGRAEGAAAARRRRRKRRAAAPAVQAPKRRPPRRPPRRQARPPTPRACSAASMTASTRATWCVGETRAARGRGGGARRAARARHAPLARSAPPRPAARVAAHMAPPN